MDYKQIISELKSKLAPEDRPLVDELVRQVKDDIQGEYHKSLPDDLKLEFQRKIEGKKIRSLDDLSSDERALVKQAEAARIRDRRKQLSPDEAAAQSARDVERLRAYRSQMSPAEATEEKRKAAERMRRLRLARRQQHDPSP